MGKSCVDAPAMVASKSQQDQSCSLLGKMGPSPEESQFLLGASGLASQGRALGVPARTKIYRRTLLGGDGDLVLKKASEGPAGVS